MIFDEINSLREDPHSFSIKLSNEFPHYKDRNIRHRPGTVPVYTREGLKAIEEVYTELQSLEPLLPLYWSVGLGNAAVGHCRDTGALGIVGHIGSQETSLQERIEVYGKWSGNVIEALDYGSVSAFEVVLSLLVDDGLPTRPHRKALLNPNFTKIGVGAGPHSEFKTMACLIFSALYEDHEHVEWVHSSEERVPVNPEIEDWMEGAVKVTCEVREDVERGVKIKRIKKHWQMTDGSIRTVDEVLREEKKEEVRAKAEEKKIEKHESLGEYREDENLVRELVELHVGEHDVKAEGHLDRREEEIKHQEGHLEGLHGPEHEAHHESEHKTLEIHHTEPHHSEPHFGVHIDLEVKHPGGHHTEERKRLAEGSHEEHPYHGESNHETKTSEEHVRKESEDSHRLGLNAVVQGTSHDSSDSDHEKKKKKGNKHAKENSNPTDSASSSSSDD